MYAKNTHLRSFNQPTIVQVIIDARHLSPNFILANCLEGWMKWSSNYLHQEQEGVQPLVREEVRSVKLKKKNLSI